MEYKSPDYWPKEFEYTPLPFSKDINLNILSHLLYTGNDRDNERIHPLIEEKSVHSHLTINKITDEDHPLSKGAQAHYGVFATDEIKKGNDLGTFGGIVRLMPKGWKEKSEKCDYALVMDLGHFTYVIDGKKWANEMVLMNDYRGISKNPNVHFKTIIHRGRYYPMFYAAKEIEKGDELVWDYGDQYWQHTKAKPAQ